MFPDYKYLMRRSVSDSLKRMVLERDNYSCCYCWTTLSFETAHIDHAFPRSKGGWTVLENLRSSCSSCNLSKGDKTEVECLTELARKASIASYLAGVLGSSFRKGPY
jgi:5-methylcytosine-specific restriction endonuclease McrA